MTHRIRALAAGAFAAAVALTGPTTAGADTLPTDVPTITMTVRNDTDSPMVLAGVVNQYGRWVDGAASVIAAKTTETITASSDDGRGFGVQVTYTMPGDAAVVMMANNHGTGPANTDGTRVNGTNHHRYAVTSAIGAGYPFMTTTFTVTRP